MADFMADHCVSWDPRPNDKAPSTPEEFKAFEADVLARLRDIRERQIGETAALTPASGDVKVTGVEATAYDSPEE